MNRVAITTFISYLLTCFLGVLSHFVYGWSNNRFLIGLFFPVNESTWEHLKLVFFPLMIVSLIEYFMVPFHHRHPGIICIKLKSAIIGMISTVILFYTINGMFGKTPDYINITIYFISMAIAYFFSYQQMKVGLPQNNPTWCLVVIFLIILLFMVFTVFPPDIPLFQAP